METESYTNNSHLGRKIERIRRLRGMTQTDLGELLGVTKPGYFQNGAIGKNR